MYIGDEGAAKVARVLAHSKNVSIVELKGNNIGPSGFEAIFEALKTNFNLRSLNLEWNKLGGADLRGLEALYSLMNNNRSITHLDLRNNRITA
jgi:Ran GTPase-activating protein (RanGAP) involved in mRNA processing and transport